MTEGPRGKFVGCCRRHIWVTSTAENFEVFIGRFSSMEMKVWGGESESFGGELVDEVCGGVECLNPVDRRKTRLKQE
jgi:hypothetical protein